MSTRKYQPACPLPKFSTHRSTNLFRMINKAKGVRTLGGYPIWAGACCMLLSPVNRFSFLWVAWNIQIPNLMLSYRR